jgi:hypothetical protein
MLLQLGSCPYDLYDEQQLRYTDSRHATARTRGMCADCCTPAACCCTLLLRLVFRWLAPGGLILPDAAALHVTGIDDKQYLGEQTKLWGNRRMGPGDGYGLKPVLNAVIKHPRVDAVTRGQLVTDTQQLLSLDLYKTRLQVRGRGLGVWRSCVMCSCLALLTPV